MPLVPVLAVPGCLFVMVDLPVQTWLGFLAWMAAGLAIYLLYGRRGGMV